MYVPLAVPGWIVTLPSASIRIGPVVTGVTSVLAVVTATPFNVSAPFPLLAKTLPATVVAVAEVATVPKLSSLAINSFLTSTVILAVLQFTGVAPVSQIV
ncbi:hypothetical protein MRP92_06470 [Flavobacterium covae]|uniref:hypothetical protein n=1 Tax=Flavobacterium covae TaxID=2906076 RepID=UPI001FB784B2|nr:hypothetical protein [Flavobacterium covae]MCJ1806557.1 hypothetical protein [Flavobacterium covae]